ncbi:hypothetical protein [Pedobacter sp. D749]|uniref:hypothetical protein n=1 Tax=Pedobacter sp. D749 TaxID=2856523 RepID=UPI001C5715DC|nr:hypothetical protein [Pedobacter sp. D749]QXU43255.1 hypothetical protein KYH19_06625 [Pedobacter sp. D749]
MKDIKFDKIKARIDELILFGEEVLKTQRPSAEFIRASVNNQMFNELRSVGLSFLQTVFNNGHPIYIEFDAKAKLSTPHDTVSAIGILKAAKREIDGGWLFSLKELLSAEIFSDFLEMAEHLLDEDYKDPAAVMIGSVLEEHLRQQAINNSIALEIQKPDKTIPKKADTLNSELASQGIYNKLDQKSITAWLDLRNKAAHGKYREYSKEQVNLMYQGVVNFIARTS